jgi:hypothetical protein
MSTTLLELIEQAGWSPTTDADDANWLLAKRSEFEELVEKAQVLVDAKDEAANAEAEAAYKKSFPDEEEE